MEQKLSLDTFCFFRATILLRFAATAANVEFHSRFTNRATIVVKKIVKKVVLEKNSNSCLPLVTFKVGF